MIFTGPQFWTEGKYDCCGMMVCSLIDQEIMFSRDISASLRHTYSSLSNGGSLSQYLEEPRYDGDRDCTGQGLRKFWTVWVQVQFELAIKVEG